MRMDHVGLNVADLDAMTTWYCQALELEREFDFTLEAIDIRGTMLRSSAGHRVELIMRGGSVTGIQATDPADAALTRGFSHFALDVTDVDATYDALLAAGAGERLSPRPSPEPGVRVAFVADPEGNLIELLDRSSTTPTDHDHDHDHERIPGA